MSTRRLAILIVPAALALAAGCQSDRRATVHPDATAADGMFEQITKLAGEWNMDDGEGDPETITFAVTSAGSAVREIMFPGQPYEMTNLYHADGEGLVLTHYCAAGNQPRMIASEAVETAEGTEFRFEFDRVSNLRESHDHYMGNMTLTILKDGGIREEWRSYDREGNLTDPAIFVLSRKFNW